MFAICASPYLTQAESSKDNMPVMILEGTATAGGVVVHLGCADGKFTAALYTGDALLVRGLDTDADDVAAAREHIDSVGLYGKVTAEQYDGENLPYGDNMINLVVFDAEDELVPAEIERVLVPGGSVVVPGGRTLESQGLAKADDVGPWTRYTKPRPADIDEWTHFLYDASGNAVCKDKKIRYPRQTQWHAGPRFSRHHDTIASMVAMTSSEGRVFYIHDEGPISVVHRPAQWRLIARDAFNGKLLWKRDIATWMTHLYNFRAGPAQMPRRLVSVHDHVYTTLGWDAPAVKLDAATGSTVQTYEGSQGAEELVLHDGVLLVATSNTERHIEASDQAVGYWDRAEIDVPVPEISVMAYDAASGKQLWKLDDDRLSHLMPLSLGAIGDRVFYLDNKQLHCLNVKTGKPHWSAPFEPPAEGIFMRNYAPTVVAQDDVILCLTWKSFIAYSMEDGQELWQHKGAIGFGSPGDLFVIDGKAWTFPMVKGMEMPPRSEYINGGTTGMAVDIRTGEIVEELPFERTQHHHRCYRNKATEDYFLLGHSGIQVADRKTQKIRTHRWVRGECGYGIMPANGYLYVPPDTCQCYFNGKINGFFALSDKNSWADVEVDSQLERGPAYESEIANPQSDLSDQDWPTYRGNAARSGAVATNVSGKPKQQWKVTLGQSLSAPVVAGGRVYLADRNGCTVHCLDAESGKPIWKFFTNGPVDSPPTIAGGRCVFGSHDGSVYCVNAASGELAWRFKTSRIERRIGWENRLASPLPIHGSVLVVDTMVYFAAGHSTNLDGGIRLYGLDLESGRQLHFAKLASGHWGDDGQYGYLADILSYSGDGTIGMRTIGFNKQLEQLKQSRYPGMQRDTALLDNSWFHRRQWKQGGNRGKLIVFDGERTVAAGNIYTGLKGRRKVKATDQTGSKWNQVGHFHQKFARYLKEEWFPVGTVLVGRGGGVRLNTDENIQVRAMVMTAEKLCVAGWLDEVAIELKTGRPKNRSQPDPREGVLRIFSLIDGQQLSEYALPAEPVYDGLAAANGRLYNTCKDGSVLCFH